MKRITLLDFHKNRTQKTKRWLGWLAFGMMICFGQMSFAQVSDYSFSQSEGVFTSIATDGDIVTGSEATTGTTNDTSGWTVTIPFSFNFNGGDYTSIYVNSNGGATFGSTTSTGSTVISATTGYDGAIAVMNRDLWGVFITSGVTTSGSDVITDVGNFYGLEIGKQLNNVNGIPSGATVTAFDEVAGTITMSAPATSSSASAVVRYGSGKVFTKTEGTAPNRVFVIEWSGYNDWSSVVTGSNFMSFQLRLEETSNAISIVYGDYYNVSTTSRTNQIGLRGATAADFNNRLGAVGNPWNSTSPGTASGSTVSRDNTNFPASGLTFSWSPPACLAPSGLNSSLDSTFTTATLGWTGTASLFDVEWGDVGFTQGSGTVVDNIATNSLIVSPLTPNMSYSFYVRQNCGVDGYSNWAGPYTFYAGYCVPTTTGTYYFTNISTSGGDSNVSLTKTAKDTGGYGDYSATQIVSGFEGQSIGISMTMNASTHYFFGWIDLNNDGDFNDAGENIISANTSYSLTYSGTLTIPTLPLGDYRIRIGSSWSGAITSCGSANGEYQDFTLTVVAPPPCMAPTALTATMLSMSSAEFSWTSTGSLFDLEWGVQGFTPGTGTMVTDITTTSHQVTGLTLGTTYEFYVLQDCGAVDGESIWSGPVSVYVGFCIPTYGSGCTSGDDIDDFTLTGSGISHIGTGCSTGSYADYSADPTLQGTVTQGETYSFSATHNFGSQYVKIWIDFNDNGTFEDTELLFTSTTGSAATSGTITIPIDAPLGVHRMRVQGKWNSVSTNACNPTGFGETHDYTVTVTDPCAGVLAPTGDATQEVASGSTLADLDVTAVGTLTWYSDVTLTTVVSDTTEFDQTGEFTYWVTNTEGACESDALEVTVTVTDPCSGVLTPTGDTTQDAELGDTLADLDVTAAGTLTWYADATLTTVVSDTTEFDQTGEFTYWVTNTEGACESAALEVTVTVTDPCDGVNPPTADSPQTLSDGQTVADIVVTDVTGTLTWYDNDGNIINDSMMLTEGSYTFWVTQTIDGCESDPIAIEVEVTLSRNDFDNASFRAYPNPVKDFFNVSYGKDITNVSVVNMLGQTVINQTVNATATQIDMTGLPTGNYLIKVTVDGAVKTVKVIKQ